MAKDTFGITQLYPTKSGAREWTSNWHSSTTRSFRNMEGQQWEFPVTSGQNQDPQDAEFTSMAAGPTSWRVDGTSGIARWQQEKIPPSDTIPSCRPFIIDIPAGVEGYDIGTQSPARKTWENVEMTVYVMSHGWALPTHTSANNGSFVRLAGPGNHFNILDCNCDGAGYSFNVLGYSNHSYAFLMHKEIVHDTYSDPSDTVNVAQSAFTKTPSWSKRVDYQRFPLFHWIGLKFVQRKITSSGYVKIEGYRDIQDGNMGGHWQKMCELTDDGIDGHWGARVQATRDELLARWNSAGHCSNSGTTTCIIDPAAGVGDYNPLVNTPRYSCYLRIQNFFNVFLKKFSIREIDPL